MSTRPRTDATRPGPRTYGINANDLSTRPRTCILALRTKAKDLRYQGQGQLGLEYKAKAEDLKHQGQGQGLGFWPQGPKAKAKD